MIHRLNFSLGVGKLQISLQPYWSDLLNTKDMEHKLAKRCSWKMTMKKTQL